MAPSPPFVSFVVPTYNAARLLPRCLASIRKQRYPRQRYEIIVADGLSEDGTAEVARAFGATVVWNHRRDAQIGKACGIAAARGEFIALLDADNEIVQEDWLPRLLEPLLRHPHVMGVESDLLVPPGDYFMNRYCALLRLEDPVARCLGLLRRQVSVTWHASTLAPPATRNGSPAARYALLTVKPGRAPVFGANGFLWRREVLLQAPGVAASFDEADAANALLLAGHRTVALVPGVGIYHHHIRSVGQFWRKRLRTGSEFLARRRRKGGGPERLWTSRAARPRQLYAVLQPLTLVAPLLESLDGLRRTRDPAWLAHLPVALGSLAIYGFCLLFTAFTGRDPQGVLQRLQAGGCDRPPSASGAPASTPPEPSNVPRGTIAATHGRHWGSATELVS
ncbi:MAG: glycosyltransferase [Candidatus Tectomicrobia bacterium]|nr:glycosyltransferase [Candidatus Tectomicrobia bacterium]